MALIGNHEINYRLPPNSNLQNLSLGAKLLFTETDYVYTKNFGTDTWKLNIGQILSNILAGLNNTTTASPTSVSLQHMEVLSFKKGLMQWSTHSIDIKIDHSVLVNNNVLHLGSVHELGSGSGTEFGFLTYIPILGNANFDKGIEIAVFRSLEKCLFRISEEIKPALGDAHSLAVPTG